MWAQLSLGHVGSGPGIAVTSDGPMGKEAWCAGVGPALDPRGRDADYERRDPALASRQSIQETSAARSKERVTGMRIPRDGERGFHGNVNRDSRGS